MRTPDQPLKRNYPPAARVLAAGLCLLLAFVVRLEAATRVRDAEFLLRNWDTEDGLPSSTANGMARDREGYLWVATWRGVARFDGNRWVVLNSRSTPALPDERLQNVWADRSGRLWLAPIEGGLEMFATNVFTAVLPSAATGGTFIRGLAEDKTGALWLATADGMLCLRDGSLLRQETTNGLPGKDITAVVCDGAQRMWAVADGALLTLRDGRWQEAPQARGLKVITIAAAHPGGVWVAAWEGPQMRLLDLQGDAPGSISETIPWPANVRVSTLTGLAEDASGRVWCAAREGVMVRHPEGRWHQLLPNPEWGRHEIMSLLVDAPDTVWLGSRRTGLHQARPRVATTLALPDAAPAQTQILTVAVGHDDSIWAGTDAGGICRWANGEVNWLGRKEGLSDRAVNALLEDRRTNLWAGTGAGLCRWDGARFQPVQNVAPLRRGVQALLEDVQGDLWVGGEAGLARWHDNRAEAIALPGVTGAAFIAGLAEDTTGRIWAGTASGLLFVKAATAPDFQPMPAGYGSAITLRSLHASADGSLWILTDGQGLFRWRESGMDHWTWSQSTLPSDHQFAALEDAAGNLWMSCERGLFGIARQTLNRPALSPDQAFVSWRVGVDDGLAQKICSGRGQPAAARTRDGRLCFPNGPAVAVLEPAVLTSRRTLPVPVIEAVQVDGLPLTNGPSGFQMRSGVHAIAFQYTAPDPITAQPQQYRTRLEGDAWADAGDTRTATYRRLPPGHYGFQVAVAKPDGTWPYATAAVPFEIVPRFHERGPVRAAAALLVILATAGGVWRWERLRSARRLARLEFQQEMDRERSRIARDIHDELGSGLTEIILLSDSLRHDGPGPGEEKQLAQDINERAKALTQDMDEVVWAVDARNDTVEGLLNYLNDFAQGHLNLAGIACHLDIPPDIPNQPISAEVRHNLFLAAKEAINNITRHSGATAATVRVVFAPPELTLTVEDNGRGFEAGNTRPHGSGLRNMNQRLAENGGECVIEPRPGGGTRVRFKLRINAARPA
jgi:ligand-binding sensor domain-containing protein/signal transduction histidine kinase